MSPSLDSAQTGPGPPGVGARAGPRSVGRTAPYRDTLEANVQLEDTQLNTMQRKEHAICAMNKKIKRYKDKTIIMIPISMFA